MSQTGGTFRSKRSASLGLAPSPVGDRRYFIALLVGLVCAAEALHGSDAVPVQTEADSVSISTAKQQLDQMKSANTAVGAGIDAKLAPQLPMTPLNPANDYVAPTTKQKSDALRRRRSDNWLVDAMMRPDPKDPGKRDNRNGVPATAAEARALGNSTTSLDGSDSLLGDHDDVAAGDPLEDGTFSSPQSVAANTPRSAAAAQSNDKPERVADFNPFAQYLSDWLSPQDSSLLKTTVEAPNPAQSGAGGPNSLPTPGDSGASRNQMGLAAFGDRGDATAAKPDDNPFLQFLKTPDAPSLPPPPASVDAAPPPSASGLPAVPDASSKATVPDFAKPAFDDKYWKPLKRF